MKFLCLVRNQFSRFWLREWLLVLQIVAMLCLITPVTTSIAAFLSIDRLAAQLSKPALFLQADSRYLVPDDMSEQTFLGALRAMENLAGPENTGRVTAASASWKREGTMEQDGMLLRFYNPALAGNTRIPLRGGSQRTQRSDGRLPLLISQALARKYRMGDSIAGASVYFPVSRQYVQMDFVVAGVMDSNGYYYAFMGGGSDIGLDALGARNSDAQQQGIVLAGYEKVPALDISASCLLFVGEDSEEVRARLNDEASRVGTVSRLSDMRKTSLRAVVRDHPMVFLAAMLMIVLCVMGAITFAWLTAGDFLGRFGMYAMCGMTWRKGFAALMTAHAVPMLVSVPLAALLVWHIPMDISREGLHMALLLILPISLLCFVLASLQFRTADPILLIRQSD